MYVHTNMYARTYVLDRKSHCVHYLLFLIYIIENNNECIITQKQKEILLDIISKNLNIVGKSVAKFSEPYGTGKNMLFHYSYS